MAPALDVTFAALADPSRRRILERLAQGRATVGDVAEPLAMALPSVSKHVKVLESARLITRTVEGRRHWLELDPAGFRRLTDYLGGYERYWEASLERLGRLVAELDATDRRP